MNILAVEFPGYGIYKNGLESNEKTILEDAHYVMEFVVKIIGILPENILLMGRSIGTGPATEMASLYQTAALILVSAFTSLKNVIRD